MISCLSYELQVSCVCLKFACEAMFKFPCYVQKSFSQICQRLFMEAFIPEDWFSQYDFFIGPRDHVSLYFMYSQRA
jgi:hypothetical protein